MSRIDPNWWTEKPQCHECGSRDFVRERVPFRGEVFFIVALFCKACGKLNDVWFQFPPGVTDAA